jgi:hypothetical protein
MGSKLISQNLGPRENRKGPGGGRGQRQAPCQWACWRVSRRARDDAGQRAVRIVLVIIIRSVGFSCH